MRYTLYNETTRTSSTFFTDDTGSEGVILETVRVPEEIELLAMQREDD